LFVCRQSGDEEKLPHLGARLVALRLYRLAKAQRVLIGWATVALVVSSVASMAIPSFIGKIIDAVSVNGSTFCQL
jgi:ABC-type multidrug transport system fused ATPase/permease subunit